MEAGDNTYLALSKGFANAVALHFKNLGLGVHSVGDDAYLATRETDGVDADSGQSHTHQSHRDAFASGEQHVEFSGWLHRRDIVGEFDQVVGRLTHGRNHDDHIVAVALGEGHMFGHGTDTFRVGDRSASVFLDNECHKGVRLPLDGPQFRLFT